MSEWIKCSERMPEPWLEVLVVIDGKRGTLWRNNHNLVAYADAIGRFHEERHNNELIGVTHWMPLPEPPQEP